MRMDIVFRQFSFAYFLIISLKFLVVAKEYNLHDPVPVLVNNVGPFNNPAEVYKYSSLPFCMPKDDEVDSESMGEVLAGDRRRLSLYDVRFRVANEWQKLCRFRLSQDEIRQFRDAIEKHYIFEMFVDGLPVKGFIGEMEHSSARYDKHVHNETRFFLFTHLDFSIAYNGPYVIAVNLTTDPEQRLELDYGKDLDIEFSYSTSWVPTDVSFIDRHTLHARSAIGDQAVEIHWLSILNSLVLVILLMSLLAIILVHVLKKDFARYMDFDDDEAGEDNRDESGWKLVHGDVFRFPKNIMLFASCIGTGAQIFVLTVIVLSLSVIGTFYPGNRGSMYTAFVMLYALTAFIAGYVSTRLYVQLGGQKWATNAVLTASLFAGPFFLTFLFVNSVAWYYGSSSALPFKTILLIIFLWALVTFPLTIIGSIRGKRNPGSFDAPCKTNRAEREIPPCPWYRSAPIQLFIAGFLPFSAIYIELHYIFASVWGHRVYTLFTILSLAFVLLVIVTAFITVALTYFQLAIEDYRWWWRSFLSGASTGLFVYGYAVFYFFYRSEMSGILQACFFFGYMLMVSYGFSLMLGAVSYYMAQKFVRHIYLSIHID